MHWSKTIFYFLTYLVILNYKVIDEGLVYSNILVVTSNARAYFTSS